LSHDHRYQSSFPTRRSSDLMLIPSLIALAVIYLVAILSSRVEVLRIDILKYLGGEEGAGLFGLSSTSTAFFIWIVILMIYVYIASTLPVWSLLQPRDFINSHQLLLGLIILYIGLFVTNPKVTAPVTHAATDKSWLPLLFI